nr:hypothetical protein [Tanacetum cinerariifolium]
IPSPDLLDPLCHSPPRAVLTPPLLSTATTATIYTATSSPPPRHSRHCHHLTTIVTPPTPPLQPPVTKKGRGAFGVNHQPRGAAGLLINTVRMFVLVATAVGCVWLRSARLGCVWMAVHSHKGWCLVEFNAMREHLNLEEKQLEEEQAVTAQSWKLPVCYDDDDDEEEYNSLNDNIISELPSYSAVTPTEPIDSLSMGDEHLDTISATESDEFIKSCVENLVPNPSESKGENGCDVLACFTTFSNVLFDDDCDSDSSDDQSLSVEDVREKIYSNPLFDEEIILMEIDPHSFNAESDIIESLPNHDSSVIISSKIDSLFNEFAGELTLLKSILPGIDETDCHPEKEIRLTKRLLYDNSSPHPPKEIVSDISKADIESFSPSPILNEDSDSLMEEIDLFLNPDDPMPPSIEDDDDSERDILILEELLDNYSLLLPTTESYHFDIP